MSQGAQWIDRVMIPLSSLDDTLPPWLLTNEYNRIYEAVSRGTEAQGELIVQAITNALERARRIPTQIRNSFNTGINAFNTRWVYFEELVGNHHWSRVQNPYEMPYNCRDDHENVDRIHTEITLRPGVDGIVRVVLCQILEAGE